MAITGYEKPSLDKLYDTYNKKKTATPGTTGYLNIVQSGGTGRVATTDTERDQGEILPDTETDQGGILSNIETEETSKKDEIPELPPQIIPTERRDPDTGRLLDWGYTDPDTGEWVVLRTFDEYNQQLDTLRDMGLPEAPELTDVTQTPYFQAVTDITTQLQDPAYLEQLMNTGIGLFEQKMGMAPGGFTQTMQEGLTGLEQGVEGQQGISDAERMTYNRETTFEQQRMAEEMKNITESLTASGRNVEAFMSMDEMAREMGSYSNQRAAQLMNIDFGRKQVEYEALKGRWEQLYQMGEMSAQEYINNVREDRMAALEGYAQQINTVLQQNQQELMEYQTDIQAYSAQAENIYNQINLDLGVSQQLIDQAQSYYEMQMAPYYAELERIGLEAELDALEHERKSENIGNVMSGIGTIGAAAGTGFLIGGIPGAIAGGVLASAGLLFGWLFN